MMFICNVPQALAVLAKFGLYKVHISLLIAAKFENSIPTQES